MNFFHVIAFVVACAAAVHTASASQVVAGLLVVAAVAVAVCAAVVARLEFLSAAPIEVDESISIDQEFEPSDPDRFAEEAVADLKRDGGP